MDNKIDLIITVFNKEKYIDRAINSALFQYKNHFNKIIVVNDGSTDSSERVIRNYLKKNTKIKLINIKNSGVSVARNIGTKYSEAKYIVYLDADDELNEEYLFEINRLIKSYPDCKIFSTIHQNIYEDNSKKNEIFKFFQNDLKISLNPIKDFIFNFNIICSSGVCILKEEINRFPFPKKVSIGEDIYIWLKLFSVNKLAWSNRPLINIYKNAFDRTQNERFNQLPYYLKKRKEVINIYKNKLWINIYYIISFFINYFKFKDNIKMRNNLLDLKKNYRFNYFIINNTPNLLSYFIYYILSSIRNDTKKFLFFIGAIFGPNFPLFFLISYLLSDKILATQFLIIQFYLIAIIAPVTFFAKNTLFRNFNTITYFNSISFRLISVPIIFIFAFAINIFFKFDILLLFFFFNYVTLLWLCELQIIYFIRRNFYFKYLLFVLLILLSDSILLYILIKKIDYYYIFSSFFLIIYILYNKKIFSFALKKFVYIFFKFFRNFSFRNIFFTGLFNSANNFFFRYLISVSFSSYLVSDYFFLLLILTLPISFINNMYSEYISNVFTVEKKFTVISLFYILSTAIFFLFFKNINLLQIEITILFFTCLAAFIFLLINIVRLRMLSTETFFKKLSIFDKIGSICMAFLLLLGFFKRDTLLYIYFFNSIVQLFIFRKYLKDNP
jgi:glycosyltransferase involved in cell wall biosynthesis